jgi:hypothetical protein
MSNLIPKSINPPKNPIKGDTYYDTVKDVMMIYNGTNFLEMPVFVGTIGKQPRTKTVNKETYNENLFK